jgi:osmotically-inducible protein OsmY
LNSIRQRCFLRVAASSNFTLKGLPILVQTTDGVVTLSGTADTPGNREQAEKVVMNVAGVKSVQNNIVVSGT